MEKKFQEKACKIPAYWLAIHGTINISTIIHCLPRVRFRFIFIFSYRRPDLRRFRPVADGGMHDKRSIGVALHDRRQLDFVSGTQLFHSRVFLVADRLPATLQSFGNRRYRHSGAYHSHDGCFLRRQHLNACSIAPRMRLREQCLAFQGAGEVFPAASDGADRRREIHVILAALTDEAGRAGIERLGKRYMRKRAN